MSEPSGKHIPITAWAEDDRPREKLILKGRHSLSNAELIAILIRSGTPHESALELAMQLLHRVENDLNALARLGVEDIVKIKGLGEAKAISIIAALELGRRRKSDEGTSHNLIKSSADAYSFLKPLLMDLSHEEFWVLFLNRANAIIGREVISKGGIAGTVVDPKIIFKHALKHLASSVILCHNHPSGNLKPSEADRSLTKKLSEAGRLLEIPVTDHIIFSDSGYLSFADEGWL